MFSRDKGQRLIRLYAQEFMKMNVFEGGHIMDGWDAKIVL